MAGHLGKTVEQLGEELSSSELTEWVALLKIEPWGAYRSDYQAAMTAWSSIAVWNKESKISDFLPRWGAEEENKVLTIEEQAAFMRSLGSVEVKKNG